MYSYVYNIYILNKNSNSQVKIEQGNIQYKIKGPDNPTSQLLPIRSNKCCSGTGKEGKTKGGGEGSRSKNSCVGQSRM